jgi:hypothetical protein
MVAMARRTGSGSCRRPAAVRIPFVVVVAATLAGGWCHAQEASPDILQLALSPSPAALRAERARPLSLSVTAPVAGTSFGQAADGNADIGVSWRAPLASQQVDITAWRRMGPPTDALSLIQQRDPTFGARLEYQLPKPRSGFASDLRFIGMQLDNGARIGLRRANGNPTLYYRHQF